MAEANDRGERETPTAVNSTYEGVVRSSLLRLGSPNPDGDLAQTGPYWKNCQSLRIAPEVCAALIYEVVRHKHDQTVMLRENVGLMPASGEPAAAAPTHQGEEWEVRVQRHKGYSINKMVEAAGRKPDEITDRTVIWGDFRDDERARDFARKLTIAGFITSYGPRAKMAAERIEAVAERVGFHWVDVSFAKQEDADKFAKLVDKQSGRIGSFVGGTAHGATVTTNANHETIQRVLKKHRWHGAYSVPAAAAEACEVAGDPSAMETILAVAEPVGASSVPWVKVTRDVDRYSAAVRTADKIGPIKDACKVYELLGDALNKEDQEVFCVVLLDLRGNLRGVCEVARGQRSRVTVGVADVLRPVITSGAEGFIVVHQHPSGKCSPSKADRDLTKLIADAAKPYGNGVTFIDHCVIGLKEVFSICENKLYKV